MNKLNTLNKAFVAFIVLILSFSSISVHEGTFAGISAPDKVLDFLRSVISVDVQKYNLTFLGPFTDNPSFLDGLTRTHGMITLQSGTGKIEVPYSFVNNSLASCIVDIRDASPKFTQPPSANMRDAARNFLEKYQLFTEDPSLDAMKNLLENADLTKSGSFTSGNLRLGVDVRSNHADLYWQNMYYGAGYSGLNLEFQDGMFNAVIDDRSYMHIGGGEAKLTQEQAVSLALACAANFSYTYGGQQFSNLEIAASQIRSELLAKGRDSPLVWYPYWLVTLPLNKYYPGSISCIVVEIWADTSQVIACYPIGSDVGPSENPTPTPSASPTSSSSPSPTSSPSQSAAPTQLPSPTVSPSPIVQPTQTTEPFSPQPTESPSFTAQPIQSASPQSTGNSEQEAGFPVQTAVAIVVVAVIVCVAVSAAWFLRKRRT